MNDDGGGGGGGDAEWGRSAKTTNAFTNEEIMTLIMIKKISTNKL